MRHRNGPDDAAVLCAADFWTSSPTISPRSCSLAITISSARKPTWCWEYAKCAVSQAARRERLSTRVGHSHPPGRTGSQGAMGRRNAAFEGVKRLNPDLSRSLHVQWRLRGFRAQGRAAHAVALIADAQEQLPEATPLWSALSIEAIRYKLPKSERERFEARWTTWLPKKVRSETAGGLAELMVGFVGGENDYPGRAGHIKEVAGNPAGRPGSDAHDDLAKVCSFLGLLPNETKWFEQLAKRGLKLYPDSPLFLMICGSIEMKRGPFGGGNFVLCDALQKARSGWRRRATRRTPGFSARFRNVCRSSRISPAARWACRLVAVRGWENSRAFLTPLAICSIRNWTMTKTRTSPSGFPRRRSPRPVAKRRHRKEEERLNSS